MTQKSGAKPSSDASAKVVVFGLDSNWRPHAAWFPKAQADKARAAAKQLRLDVIEVSNGTAADLVAKLPAGQIHTAGPAMVPPVREDLYEKVVATINSRGEAGKQPGEPIVTDLPETWAAIKPGHLVLIFSAPRDLALRRAVLPERRTGAALGDMQMLSDMLDAGATTRGAQ